MSNHFPYHSNQHLSIKNWRHEKTSKKKKAFSSCQHSDREFAIFDRPPPFISPHCNVRRFSKTSPERKKVLEDKRYLSGCESTRSSSNSSCSCITEQQLIMLLHWFIHSKIHAYFIERAFKLLMSICQ